MSIDSLRNFFTESPSGKLIGALILTSPLIIYAFYYTLPITVDWRVFGEVSRIPLSPYDVTGFRNLPWFALILSPLGIFSIRTGEILNSFLNLAFATILFTRYGGKPLGLVLLLTSVPFAKLIIFGNVEWIPMAAFLLPPQWGLPILVTKPQSGIMAATVWFKKADNKLLFLLPTAVITLASFIIWGWWPSYFININAGFALYGGNSPWPYLIPLGIVLSYIAWKNENEMIATGATYCLTPYLALHSTTLFLCMLAAKKPRIMLAVWVVLWYGAIFGGWEILLGKFI